MTVRGRGVYVRTASRETWEGGTAWNVDSHDWTVMLLKVGKLSRDQEIGAAWLTWKAR